MNTPLSPFFIRAYYLIQEIQTHSSPHSGPGAYFPLQPAASPPPTDSESEDHKVSPFPEHLTHEDEFKIPYEFLFEIDFLLDIDIILSVRNQYKQGILMHPNDRNPSTEIGLSHVMSKQPDLEFNLPLGIALFIPTFQ